MKRRLFLGMLLSPALGVGARAPQVRRQLLGIAPPADAFFDDSIVQEVRLTMSDRDWLTLKRDYLGDDYYTCEMRWRDQVVRNIGIRSRGTGSRSGIKPGLRVDLDRYIGGLRFLGLKSFVLRNNTQDPSNLHERLSMLLFRRLGIPASREAHARFYVNNEYAGLYTIVESVDKGFLQRAYGEDNGYLYDYTYPADAQPYYFEDRGADPSRYVPLPFKPETHEDNPRPEFIVQFVQTINQSGAGFRSAMAEYLEIDKFIRHVAVETYLTELDGIVGDYGLNNFYFHRFDNRKLFTFIPWDKSEAFKGAVNRDIFRNMTDVPSNRRNRLMNRILEYPDLVDLYLETLLECVRSAGEPEAGASSGPGWLEREIEREYQQIRAAALEDPVKPFTNEEFEGSIEALRVFARERGTSVIDQVNRTRGQ